MSNDVVLVILPKNSLSSDWVEWTLASARERERTEGRDFICPIAHRYILERMGRRPVLKREVLKYQVVSFENWTTASSFEESTTKLQPKGKMPAPFPKERAFCWSFRTKCFGRGDSTPLFGEVKCVELKHTTPGGVWDATRPACQAHVAFPTSNCRVVPGQFPWLFRQQYPPRLAWASR